MQAANTFEYPSLSEQLPIEVHGHKLRTNKIILVLISKPVDLCWHPVHCEYIGGLLDDQDIAASLSALLRIFMQDKIYRIRVRIIPCYRNHTDEIHCF